MDSCQKVDIDTCLMSSLLKMELFSHCRLLLSGPLQSRQNAVLAET